MTDQFYENIPWGKRGGREEVKGKTSAKKKKK